MCFWGLSILSSQKALLSVVFFLFGSESWILNDTLLKKLQAYISRLPSVCAQVLFSKLVFLWKLMTSNDSLSSKVFRILAVTDVESIHLVRQCLWKPLFVQVLLRTSYCVNQIYHSHSSRKIFSQRTTYTLHY